MSGGSDWLNLFVHQGKELIDSVSGQKKRDILPSETQRKLLNSSTKEGVSFVNNSTEGSIKFEESNGGSDLKVGRSTSMALEAAPSSSSDEKKTLTQGEREVYENQLEKLQEQLVDIMIKNQEMDAELNSLRECDVSKLSKELEKEKIKRRQLEVKLKKLKDDHDSTPKLRRRKQHHDDSSIDHNEPSACFDHKTSATSVVSEKPYQVPEGDKSLVSRFKFWLYRTYFSLVHSITLTFWNIVSDLSEDESKGESADEDGPALAIKTLKGNINRFSKCLKPIKEYVRKVDWVLSWKNPAATMLIFMVYVFSFWHGYTVSLLLFLAIVQLSANFVYTRFGTDSDTERTETVPEPPSWSDRFQIVLHVARKVQNVLGSLSNNLEKLKNLLMWKAYHVTLKLYTALWFLFFASIFSTGQQFFTLLGILLGYKLFITGPLYTRFPKLKKRYDTTHRLWLELPTDCDLDADLDVDEPPGSSIHRSSTSLISESSSINSKLFCERYKLTSDEVFVKGWEDGWRASLMNKQKPLVNVKHGRLYLTQNYLCFERSRSNTTKNILIKLNDIKSVNKYKPLFILPGTGMSIEVYIKDKEEPYVFGAIIGRDDAYNDIMQAARNAELSWAK